MLHTIQLYNRVQAVGYGAVQGEKLHAVGLGPRHVLGLVAGDLALVVADGVVDVAPETVGLNAAAVPGKVLDGALRAPPLIDRLAVAGHVGSVLRAGVNGTARAQQNAALSSGKEEKQQCRAERRARGQRQQLLVGCLERRLGDADRDPVEHGDEVKRLELRKELHKGRQLSRGVDVALVEQVADPRVGVEEREGAVIDLSRAEARQACERLDQVVGRKGRCAQRHVLRCDVREHVQALDAAEVGLVGPYARVGGRRGADTLDGKEFWLRLRHAGFWWADAQTVVQICCERQEGYWEILGGRLHVAAHAAHEKQPVHERLHRRTLRVFVQMGVEENIGTTQRLLVQAVLNECQAAHFMENRSETTEPVDPVWRQCRTDLPQVAARSALRQRPECLQGTGPGLALQQRREDWVLIDRDVEDALDLLGAKVVQERHVVEGVEKEQKSARGRVGLRCGETCAQTNAPTVPRGDITADGAMQRHEL
eukprot:PhM_4_TR16785/c0_g1_i1/m.103429